MENWKGKLKLLVLFTTIFTEVFTQEPEYPPPIGVNDFDWDTPTLLDTYVHSDDGYYSWELLDIYNYSNVDMYIINMTSQKWLDETQVSRSVWWHNMGVAIPHEIVNYTTAWMLMGGGSNNNPDEVPGRASTYNLGAVHFANTTGCIAAYVLQSPNGPIVFADDATNKSRSGDSLIAYTWRHVVQELESGIPPNEVDMEIVARLPMTKTGKRGLDTIAAVASKYGGPDFDIHNFVVAGASKRGWDAWSLPAVDKRVIATSPLVMSYIWFEETLIKHYRALGGAYSFTHEPYWDEGLSKYYNNPMATPIWDLEDPFRYRTRLSEIPILMIASTGDEIFLNHDSHSFWRHMKGVTHIMMNPNTDHFLFPHWLKVLQTVLSWFQIIVTEGPSALPKVSWTREELVFPNLWGRTGGSMTRQYGDERSKFEDSGRITFVTDPPPDNIKAFRSETLQNDTIRDWRWFAGFPEPEPHPVFWADENVTQIEEGVYEHTTYKIDDENRWVAHLVQGEWITTDKFPGDREMSMFFTSEVNIIPDTYPADECQSEECYGYLV